MLMNMSNDKKKSKKSYKRRSALSFELNGSIDIDHILELSPWKDIEQFEEDEVGCIQNVLNEFNNRLSQEKLYPAENMPKQNTSKQAKKPSSRDVSPNPQNDNVKKSPLITVSESSSIKREHSDAASQSNEVLHTSTPTEQLEKPIGQKANTKKVSKQLIKDSKDKAIQVTLQKQKASEKKNNQDKNSTNQTEKIKKEQQSDAEQHDKKNKKCKKQRRKSTEDLTKIDPNKKQLKKHPQTWKQLKQSVIQIEELARELAHAMNKFNTKHQIFDNDSSDESFSSETSDSESRSDSDTSISESESYTSFSTENTTESTDDEELKKYVKDHKKSTKSDTDSKSSKNKKKPSSKIAKSKIKK